MALLLQCLRDVRTMSGDLDLLPPTDPSDAAGEASSRPSLAAGSAHEPAEHTAEEQAT